MYPIVVFTYAISTSTPTSPCIIIQYYREWDNTFLQLFRHILSRRCRTSPHTICHWTDICRSSNDTRCRYLCYNLNYMSIYSTLIYIQQDSNIFNSMLHSTRQQFKCYTTQCNIHFNNKVYILQANNFKMYNCMFLWIKMDWHWFIYLWFLIDIFPQFSSIWIKDLRKEESKIRI